MSTEDEAKNREGKLCGFVECIYKHTQKLLHIGANL